MAMTNTSALILSAFLLCAGALHTACANRSQEPTLVSEQQSQLSPSGKFTASVEVEVAKGKPAWRVIVKDGQRRDVFRSGSSFSTRHRTVVTWEEREDRLWIYSGDVGTIVIGSDAHGVWNEVPEKGLTPPPVIRKIYDKLRI